VLCALLSVLGDQQGGVASGPGRDHISVVLVILSQCLGNFYTTPGWATRGVMVARPSKLCNLRDGRERD
jgi:hypothetical protein